MIIKLRHLFIAIVALIAVRANAYKSSAADICFNSLADRALWSNGIVKLDELSLNRLTTSQKIQKLSTSIHNAGEWTSALIPLLETQYGTNKISNFLEKWHYSIAQPISNKKIPVLQKECLTRKSEYPQISLEYKLMLTLSCGQLALTDAINCQKAVEDQYNESNPVVCGAGRLTYPKIWYEILSDKKFYEGFNNSSLSIAAQIENREIVDKNLLETLRKGYLKSGFNQKDSEESAWKVIAIIANGAQNTSGRVNAILNDDRIVDDFDLLSRSMGIIDFENFKTFGSSYTFPEEIVGHCQTTKPYHFWMAAYQARNLTNKGFSKRAAMMAILTLAKAYHTQERGALAFIFQSPYDHPTISVVRHDLILSVLGAAYGAGVLKGKRINIESIFSKVFSSRPTVGNLDFETEAKPLSEDKVRAF